MKIGVLTSSRADYGIYNSLLKLLFNDQRFDLHIIAFGMHLQPQYGNTIEQIKNDNYGIIHTVIGMSENDNNKDISSGYGKLIINFSNFWNSNKFDWVFALGDRFEMSAAVQSGIPFQVNYAHIHGGETTMGAIDNIYRHQISLASKLHFTSSALFSQKVSEIVGYSNNIYNVGSLSLDKIDFDNLPSWNKVCKIFNIPDKPFILVTFHPETIGINQNINLIKVISNCLTKLSRQVHIVITQANADAEGSLYRDLAIKLKNDNPASFSVVESFGKINYFSAMKNCEFLLGNTSSGIIEAASFRKFTLNVGERQSGRLRSENVIDVDCNSKEILYNANTIMNNNVFTGENKYYKPNTALEIIKIIKENEL